MRVKLYILIFVYLILVSFQQTPNYDVQAKIKAVYIYNFTKYFEWPNAKKTGNFIIYLHGNDSKLENELKNLTKNKKVGNQDIEIITGTELSDKANIFYLIDNNTKKIGDLSKKFKGKGVLLLTESENACKNGSCLNFVMLDNKQKVEYSKTNAVKFGLKTNDEFDKLTIKID